MPVLEARRLAWAFVPALPVLRDVSFRLSPGWYGLVGENGAGKTTLLRVLAGQLKPDHGFVRTEPATARIALCPQDADALTPEIAMLAASNSGARLALRGRLALDVNDLARWPSLSPGERKRWQVAAALAQEPDVLLVDEPTNHLDPEARTLVVHALKRFRGVGVVVSHDRQLLDELPRKTLRLHDHTIKVYVGGYQQAREAWMLERRHAEEAHGEARAHVARIRRQLAVARQEHASADRGRIARTRMKGPRDHDARGGLAKGQAAAAEARAGKDAGVLRRALERAETEVPKVERDRALGAHVFARYEPSPSSILLRLHQEALHAGTRVVLTDVALTVGRNERVRIAGPNGAGKTTLLHALHASLAHASRVLFLPQEQSRAEVASLMEQLAGLSSEARGRVLSVFAALGSDPERISRRSADGSLSPGEARKLALALGLGTHVWALILDEPTNHLDLPTTERLEAALVRYPGAVVLVSHDEIFAARCTNRVVQLSGGRAR